jgi:hypothetical protein
VRGQADEGVVADDAPDGRHGQVVLADVHAGGAGQPRHVRPIVDHEGGADGGGSLHRGIGEAQQGTEGETFRPELDQPGAAVEQRAEQVERLPAARRGDVGVEDGVQRGKHSLGRHS